MSNRVTLLVTLPVLATSAVLLALGGGAAWCVHRMNREMADLLDTNLECAIASESLVLAIRDTRQALNEYLDTGDRDRLQKAVGQRVPIANALGEVESTADTPAIRELLGPIRDEQDPFFDELGKQLDAPLSDARRQRIGELIRRLNTRILAPAEELLSYTQRAVREHSDHSKIIADRVGLGILALGCCGAISGLLVGFRIARHFAQRLEQREREAIRAEQLAAVGQLAAGLAHELRNPLTSMKLLVDSAFEAGDAEALTPRDLAVLHEEIERLESLVRSFLDFARPPSLEKSTFDLRNLVDQTMHLLSGPASRQNVNIGYVPPREPLLIEADPVQIRQVLLNLQLNALDVLGSGGNITLQTQTQEDGDFVVIQVSDDGPGVPHHMLDRIMAPFVSTKEAGLGLGLSICQRIVNEHGGEIQAANRPEKGAQFTVRLPATADHRRIDPRDPTPRNAHDCETCFPGR